MSGAAAVLFPLVCSVLVSHGVREHFDGVGMGGGGSMTGDSWQGTQAAAPAHIMRGASLPEDARASDHVRGHGSNTSRGDLPPQAASAESDLAVGLPPWFTRLRAVRAYLARGAAHCREGPLRQPGLGPGGAPREAVALAYVQDRGRGLGNWMIEAEMVVMAAWLTQRPIRMLSTKIFDYLGSGWLPPGSQFVDFEESLAGTPALGEGARLGDVLNAPHRADVGAPTPCSVNIGAGQAAVRVDLERAADWSARRGDLAIVSNSEAALREYKRRGLVKTWAGHCARLVSASERNARRIGELTRTRRHFKQCALRLALERPQPPLLEYLRPTLSGIGSSDYLVGLHIRLGDKQMNIENAGRAADTRMKATDVRIGESRLRAYLMSLNSFLETVRASVQPRAVVVFLATDTGRAEHEARKYLRFRIVMNRGKPVHTIDIARGGESSDTLKVVADWYCLALCDMLLSPTASSFLYTAADLGLQRIRVFQRGRAISQRDRMRVAEQLKRERTAPGWA